MAKPKLTDDAFRELIRGLADEEIKRYIAQPTIARDWFENYIHTHNTAEERGYIAMAQHELDRRRTNFEYRRYWITTLIAFLVLVLSCIAIAISLR